MAKTGATGAITKFPIPTVLVFLLLTAYFVSQSGFLDNTRFDDDLNNPALNVNGDLEVYLPDGSQVAELLARLRKIGPPTSWSSTLNPQKETTSPISESYKKSVMSAIAQSTTLRRFGHVIYILSLSTVLKEVNSSAPRIREAVVTEVGELDVQTTQTTTACRGICKRANEAFALTDEHLVGRTKSRARPPSIWSSARCTRRGPTFGRHEQTSTRHRRRRRRWSDGVLDRAIAIAVTEDRPAKEIIADTQEILDAISKLEQRANLRTTANPMNPRACAWGTWACPWF